MKKSLKKLLIGTLLLFMGDSWVFGQTSTAYQQPALIPQPQQVAWTNESFSISRKFSIQHDPSLDKLAEQAEKLLEENGGKFSKRSTHQIILKLGKVEARLYPEEAYHLIVAANRIGLTANTPHGIFNGLQTLRQLLRYGEDIPGCSITDYPAFAWRGLMHDVGRNFQTVPFLKKQIEVMAQYKLNVFHLHLTEDVAWRLESKLHPELTRPETMTRDTGQYYAQKKLQELIDFCRNGGDLPKNFAPELTDDWSKIKTTEAVGATVYLRHWWFPEPEGWLENPVENSTVYARARVWSGTRRDAAMWIGFNNISRSPATDSPPSGAGTIA